MTVFFIFLKLYIFNSCYYSFFSPLFNLPHTLLPLTSESCNFPLRIGSPKAESLLPHAQGVHPGTWRLQGGAGCQGPGHQVPPGRASGAPWALTLPPAHRLVHSSGLAHPGPNQGPSACKANELTTTLWSHLVL